MGWEPIEQSSHAKAHADALARSDGSFAAGTYELCGPKVNGNPEGIEHHLIISHADAEVIELGDWYEKVAARPDDLRPLAAELMASLPTGCEGIVWHHPDGRMAKLKVRDFRNG
jgi:hypothetical protein